MKDFKVKLHQSRDRIPSLNDQDPRYAKIQTKFENLLKHRFKSFLKSTVTRSPSWLNTISPRGWKSTVAAPTRNGLIKLRFEYSLEGTLVR